jgi:uncharacterized protein (DUF488 family)
MVSEVDVLEIEGKVPIYTIGYGARPVEEFIQILSGYEIRYLIDVRSRPYSRFRPEYSKSSIDRLLGLKNIRYVFMGDTLGGIPEDASVFSNGRVDYREYQETSSFKEGIDRLRVAWEKRVRVVLMCSEGKPQDCHRSKLIGDSLVKGNILVAHIDEAGALKTQEQVIGALTKGQESFPDFSSHYSRKKYLVSTK